jgi:hypothetical protein
MRLALAFAEAGFPVFPVELFFDDDRNRWRKLPCIKEWERRATVNSHLIKVWWGKWPLALPGIPPGRCNKVIVDADRHGGPDGVELFRELDRTRGPFPPHPVIPTKSGGEHHWFSQPARPVAWAKWIGGEVLGHGRFVVGYAIPKGDMPELPEVFWRVNGAIHNPIPVRADPVLVADLTAALRQMNPVEWRGQNEKWLKLMTACRWAGITCADFIAWSISDPEYEHDGDEIERRWRSLKPQHDGALRAALKARGIQVCHTTRVRHPSKPTINWWTRFNSVLNKLAAKRDGDMLFWAGCRVAEIIADTGKPKRSVAIELLISASGIKRDEALRIITNAFEMARTGAQHVVVSADV